jgi:epoxyqueuosine reductase
MRKLSDAALYDLANTIKSWAKELGFQQAGITDTHLNQYTPDFLAFLAKGFHGEMAYLADNIDKRTHPEKLVPKTVRIISVRMDYLTHDTNDEAILADKNKAYVARYALGRDYHKVMRKRLQKLATRIEEEVGEFSYRAFSDSAPVMEGPIAEKAGLGWIGKNTLLLNRKAGSWFFLGELFTNIPLPIDLPTLKSNCGSCQACMDVCPTKAIVGPRQLDATRCISYLTIEYKGVIPLEFRSLIGNRIYGCDDCQLFCPWNRFAQYSKEKDFLPRHQLADMSLLDAFSWEKEEFNQKTQGSAMRRVGYECWVRNVAVALGNAPKSPEIVAALQKRLGEVSPMVDEHIRWALEVDTHRI